MDEKIIKKCIEARHKLHQLAELSNDEIQTKIFLMEFLKKNSCLEIHDEGKWFYAVYKSKERGIFSNILPYNAQIDFTIACHEISAA